MFLLLYTSAEKATRYFNGGRFWQIPSDAGAKVITQRTDIGNDTGAFAAFTDPIGNEFGLYEEPKR